MSHEASADTKVTLRREEGFRFRVRFHHGRVSDLFTDEPPPLGSGEGPNPTALLGAAIATCLASSLEFCTQKSRVELRDLLAEVQVATTRNAEGRLRVERVEVTLAPSVDPEMYPRLKRCLDIFQSFCTVTESVRKGFPVDVRVETAVAGPAPARAEPVPATVPKPGGDGASRA